MTAIRMPVSLQVLMVSALSVVAGNPSHVYEITATAPPFHNLALGQASSQPQAWQSAATNKSRADHVARVRALRGKYASLGITSDEFIRLKYQEME